MKKLLIYLIAVFFSNSGFCQPTVDDEIYSKLNALDLYYIPENIRRNIGLGRGYDLTDPWYPILADESPFLIQPPATIASAIRIASVATRVPIGTGSNEYKMRYEENIDERTVAQFYHAELRTRGISWGVEASVEYVKSQYNIAQGVRFVLENKANIPNPIDVNTKWKIAPVTESSPLDDNAKWKLFKQKYGSHYTSSFSYGYRIEILAFANSKVTDSKLKLNLAFNAWTTTGKFDASIAENIKNSGATIDLAIFCGDIKNIQTGSSLPFIVRGIPDVLKFLDELKDGTVVITPAPTTISFKSYFASVCSKPYQKTCKLFDVKAIPVDSNAVPRGTIMAWRPPAQNIRLIGGKTIIVAPVGGWAVCDARTHEMNPRVPDLSNKFLFGTSNSSEILIEGGSESHDHGGTTGSATQGDMWTYDDPDRGGDSRKSTGPGHNHGISSASNLPPFVRVVYIIKL